MKFPSIGSWRESATESIGVFDEFVTRHALQGRAQADHICFKCGSRETFEHIRALFEHESKFIYQSIISGRRIAYLKFKTPLMCALGDIWFLELSDQKLDGSQKDGFDHIEVFGTTLTYDDMVRELAQTEKVIHVERPHHTTDDIDITPDFLFRCTQGPLIEKIQQEQME